MAEPNLEKYGITGTTEIVYNPSYEQLFVDEMDPDLYDSMSFDEAVETEKKTSVSRYEKRERPKEDESDTATKRKARWSFESL